MVAKINVGNSLFGVLAYNHDKVEQEEAKVLLSNKVFESLDGKFNIHRCKQDFEMYLPKEMKTRKPVIHISLNPHPDDRLTDQQFADIGREYIEKMGYGNQPYMIFKHEDIDRHHIHIVSLRVDEDGKKINDKFERYRSKEITREIEQKYNLHTAEKKSKEEITLLNKVDYSKGDIKKQISNTLKALSSYQYQSFSEYKILLSLYNIQAEEVKGEKNGKPYQGIVYSALNEKGEKQGSPIKSSQMGKFAGYKEVTAKINRSKDNWKYYKEKARIKNGILSILSTAKDMNQLKDKLTKQGITLITRQNEQGRIYGVTFISHADNWVFNGSKLGKELSANVFNNLFGQNNSIKQPLSDGPLTRSTGNSQPIFSGQLFAPSFSGIEETAPEKKKRKRKKRRRII